MTAAESECSDQVELTKPRYCKYTGEKDWREAIQNWDKGATMLFLHFICENDWVKSQNALHQYLLSFKMLYNQVNGFHMDTNDAREVLKV